MLSDMESEGAVSVGSVVRIPPVERLCRNALLGFLCGPGDLGLG